MRVKLKIINSVNSYNTTNSINLKHDQFLFPILLNKSKTIKGLKEQIEIFLNSLEIDSDNDQNKEYISIHFLEIDSFNLPENFEIESLIRENDVIK